MGCDEQGEYKEQRDRNEQLRSERRTMAVHLRAGRAADRATAFDDGAVAVCADQMLAAHREPLLVESPGALDVIWSLSCQFPPRLFPGLVRLPVSCTAKP